MAISIEHIAAIISICHCSCCLVGWWRASRPSSALALPFCPPPTFLACWLVASEPHTSRPLAERLAVALDRRRHMGGVGQDGAAAMGRRQRCGSSSLVGSSAS